METQCTHLKKCQRLKQQRPQENHTAHVILKSAPSWNLCEPCPMRESGDQKQRAGQPAFMEKTVVKDT